jgi:hypothetical protein
MGPRESVLPPARLSVRRVLKGAPFWCALQVKLWTLAPGGSALECIQQVSLVSDGDAHNDFFNHARFDVSSGLVLLANTKRNALYALQLTPGATPQLTSLAEFSVLYPILSFTSVCEPAERGVPQVGYACAKCYRVRDLLAFFC